MESIQANEVIYYHENGNLKHVSIGEYFMPDVKSYEIQFQSLYLNRKRELKDLVATLDDAINELKKLIK